jgi:TM2 domain-containing membrane protein YozV
MVGLSKIHVDIFKISTILVKKEAIMEEKRVVNRSFSIIPSGKNMIIAYLLWWFLGWLGVHRFYLGKPITALMQIFLFFLGVATVIILIGYLFLFIGFVWWIFDAYFTYAAVMSYNRAHGCSASGFTFNYSKETV